MSIKGLGCPVGVLGAGIAAPFETSLRAACRGVQCQLLRNNKLKASIHLRTMPGRGIYFLTTSS